MNGNIWQSPGGSLVKSPLGLLLEGGAGAAGAGAVTKRVRLNDAGDGLIFEDE